MKIKKINIMLIFFAFFIVGIFFAMDSSFYYAQSRETVSASTLKTTLNNTTANKYTINVLTIRIDPILTTQGNIRASQYMQAHDSYGFYRNYATVSAEYVNSIYSASHGQVTAKIVKEEILNEFPTYVSSKTVPLKNGSYANQFDEATWVEAMKQGIYSFGQKSYNITFGDYDYNYLINKFNLIERKNNNEFDMVWLVDLNDSGVYESCIVGKSSYWDNGDNIYANCDNFQIMALTLPRSETYMECLGHAAEFTLQRVFYNDWNISPPTVTSQAQFDNLKTWYKFLQSEYTYGSATLSSGYSVAGNVHYAPNSTTDYEWNKTNYVYSTAQDWIDNYPNISPVSQARKSVNYTTWNNYNSFNLNLSHKIWWFSVMPHVQGRDKDGYSNNWWDYLVTTDWATSITNAQTSYSYKIGDSINNIKYNLVYNSNSTATYTLDKLSANTTIVSGADCITVASDGTMTAKQAGTVTLKTYFDGKYATTTLKVLANYTVTWKDGDGNVLGTSVVVEGDIPQYTGTTPTKTADLTYTYTWTEAWDKEIVACASDTIYTATFTPVYINYTIKFVDYDDSVISTITYHYGDTVTPPTDPTREADNIYIYKFNYWNPKIINCDGNKTYKAVYKNSLKEYTITFLNYDNTFISSQTYHYGEEIQDITHPTRESDNTYTYVFDGWNKELGVCVENITFTATYKETYIDYTIIFKNGDDIICSEIYHYGDVVTPPQNPTKESDETYSYKFVGWDKKITTCDGNKTYRAVYDEEYIVYTIIFQDYDGKEISKKTYTYGVNIVVPINPTREADNTYTYTFNGWDKEVTTCDGNKTYTATYTNTYIAYTIIFNNEDNSLICEVIYHYGDEIQDIEHPTKEGNYMYAYPFVSWGEELGICTGNKIFTAVFTEVLKEYKVSFIDWDNTEIVTTNYHYGDPVQQPENPERESDKLYKYTFSAWNEEIIPICYEDKTYQATYTFTYREYVVEFVNYNDKEISKKYYHYGDTIVVPESPTREADKQYTYRFIGWGEEITTCQGDKKYVATYENIINSYTITFLNDDGYFVNIKSYNYGTQIQDIAHPTKKKDNTYFYIFESWDKQLGICCGDDTYTAVYKKEYIEYDIKFVDDNDEIILERLYHYGDLIIVPDKPTKESDVIYNYTFVGWDKKITACNGNKTYKAVYNAEKIYYIVTFKNDNGDILASAKYKYGDTVQKPENPTKESDNMYTYYFRDWDSKVTICKEDKTYTATYRKMFKEYRITFKNYDGTVISSVVYHYNDVILPPEDVVRDDEGNIKYVFEGWDQELKNVTENATYVATYKAVEKVDSNSAKIVLIVIGSAIAVGAIAIGGIFTFRKIKLKK